MSTKKLIFSPPLEHDGAKADAIVLVEPTALQVVTAEKARVAEIGVHATRVRDTALVGAVGRADRAIVRVLSLASRRRRLGLVHDGHSCARLLSSSGRMPARSRPS